MTAISRESKSYTNISNSITWNKTNKKYLHSTLFNLCDFCFEEKWSIFENEGGPFNKFSPRIIQAIDINAQLALLWAFSTCLAKFNSVGPRSLWDLSNWAQSRGKRNYSDRPPKRRALKGDRHFLRRTKKGVETVDIKYISHILSRWDLCLRFSSNPLWRANF